MIRQGKRNSALSRKIKLKLILLKEKLLNRLFLFKLVLTIILVSIALIIALVFTVSITYQRRTIKTKEEIPLEIRTGVIIINQADILYNFDNSKRLVDLLLETYSTKRVTKILIVSYNNDNSIIPTVDAFTNLFKDIPTDNYNIDISSKNLFEACNVIKDKYKVQKFVLTGYQNVLPFASYICSSQDLYVKPFLPNDLKFINKEISFTQAISLIWENINKKQ
jgi:hypothetical protein